MYHRHGHTLHTHVGSIPWNSFRRTNADDRTAQSLIPIPCFFPPSLALPCPCLQAKKKMFPASKALKGALVAALASASLGLAAPVDPATPVAPLEATAAIAPGECMSYQSGDANAVLCVQEAKLTAPNNLLVGGRSCGEGEDFFLLEVSLAPGAFPAEVRVAFCRAFIDLSFRRSSLCLCSPSSCLSSPSSLPPRSSSPSPLHILSILHIYEPTSRRGI
jgi:hypothetical protein